MAEVDFYHQLIISILTVPLYTYIYIYIYNTYIFKNTTYNSIECALLFLTGDFNSVRLSADKLLVRYMKYLIYFSHSSLTCSDKPCSTYSLGVKKSHSTLCLILKHLLYALLPFMGDDADYIYIYHIIKQDTLDLKPFWHQSSV